jgi:ABC-type antimicrobial peptide transport system permease subunit
MLYGVAPVDPLTFVAIAGGVLAIAALAAYFSARRVAAIDPVQAIRRE